MCLMIKGWIMDFETMLYLSVILNVIILICFFVLCSNVSSIKKKICPSENFGATFSMLITGNQIETARKLLFDEISKDELFVRAFYYGGENGNVRTLLNKKYTPYLEMVGVTLDFGKSDELIKKLNENAN